MEWIVVIVIVILLLIVVGEKRSKKEKELAYERQTALFSPAERSFYGVLCKVVGDRFLVLGKVRVADVIKPKRVMSRSEWQTAFNKIKAKHFDFILCNPNDLSVECVIELDDSSHNKQRRIDRDQFLDKACLSAGLTIHHFKARAAYKTSEITSVIFPEVDCEPNSDSNSDQTEEKSTENEKQVCPKCSSELVKRVAKKGGHKGSEFLACSAYPKCRYIAKLDHEGQQID